jgi:hypothetical protein
MYSLIVLPFFLQHLTNAKKSVSSWSVTKKPTWWSRIISSTYGLNSERMLDKILLDTDNSVSHNNYISFITLPINWYNNRLLPLVRQFFLIPNRTGLWISKCFKSCLNLFCWNLINTWLFIPFQVCNAISNSKGLGSGTNASAVSIYTCLTSLTLCTYNSWEN